MSEVVDRLQLVQQAVGLEDDLFLDALDIEQAREQVGEPQRVVDAGDQRPQFLGEAAGQRQRPFDQLLDPADVRVHFERPFRLVRGRVDGGAQRSIRSA